MSREQPKSILLVGNYRPSITIVRKLARENYRLILGIEGEKEQIDSSERSKHVHSVISLPTWESAGPDYASRLTQVLEPYPDINIVFPVSDFAVRFFSEIRNLLPKRVKLVLPQNHVVQTCSDKFRAIELCARLQIESAPMIRANSLDSIKAAAKDIQMPVAIKPVRSVKLLPGDRKALLCETEKELEEQLLGWPDEEYDVLVQRLVRGPRHNIYFAASQGKLIGGCELRILRTDRADGTGFAVEGQSIPPTAELKEATNKLIKELDYSGVGCAQFLVDPNSSFSFLELNPRLGANFAAVEACGLPIAKLAVQIATNQLPLNLEMEKWFAKPGSRFAWTTGDLKGLNYQWKQGRINIWQAFGWASRTAFCALRARTHITWQLSDPWPTLAEYLSLFGASCIATPTHKTESAKNDNLATNRET